MKYPSVIIVSGRMGSGKSTLVRMLAEKLGYAVLEGGAINREMARAKGMNIEDWSVYTKSHPEVDRETDRLLLQGAEKGNVVIQSRVLPHLDVIRKNPDCVTLFLDTDIETRARRLMEREGITSAEAHQNIAQRDGNDQKRLKSIYSIDTQDTSVYDLVVKNSTLSPQETLDLVFDKLQKGEYHHH